MKKSRILTVYNACGLKAPSTILRGQWLQQLGFNAGDKVEVTCAHKSLTINWDG